MRWPTAILRTIFKSKSSSPSIGPRHLLDGVRGERTAEKFLKNQRHQVLARNFHCPGGELDLVTRDVDTIVFVEVKARRDDSAADPLEAVAPVKWSRVERAALHFRARHRLEESPCRFDLITIIWNGDVARIEHIENAHEMRGK